jgi:hypothetical protein
MIDLERRVARLEALASQRGAAEDADGRFLADFYDRLPSGLRLQILEAIRRREAEVGLGHRPTTQELLPLLPADAPRLIAEAWQQARAEQAAAGAGARTGALAP